MKFEKTVSKQPRKKRLAAYNAPIHQRRKKVSAHLSKELRAKLKTRSLELKKGDTVKIIRGSRKGVSGKVTNVDTISSKIFVEKVVIKKQGGKELPIPIEPSNTIITDAVERSKKSKKPAAKQATQKK